MRWVRKAREFYAGSRCNLCGVGCGVGPRCKRVECLACHSPQCEMNGLARGTCGICYVGLLWAQSEKRCGYKGCGKQAVAEAPRVGYICEEHMDRATTTLRENGVSRKVTIRRYIAWRVRERGEEWVMVED